MTLKDQLDFATESLGEAKASAVIDALMAKLGRYPTLLQRVNALENARKAAAVSAAGEERMIQVGPKPTASRPVRDRASVADELVDKYRSLDSQEDRDSFWRAHKAALVDSGMHEVVLCRIAAGKPIQGYSYGVLMVYLNARATTAQPSQPAPAAKTLTNAEYLALSPYKRGQFHAAGGQVVVQTMSRADFSALSPSAKSKFCRTGGKLTD
jgi:hypothetical protein